VKFEYNKYIHSLIIISITLWLVILPHKLIVENMFYSHCFNCCELLVVYEMVV